MSLYVVGAKIAGREILSVEGCGDASRLRVRCLRCMRVSEMPRATLRSMAWSHRNGQAPRGCRPCMTEGYPGAMPVQAEPPRGRRGRPRKVLATSTRHEIGAALDSARSASVVESIQRELAETRATIKSLLGLCATQAQIINSLCRAEGPSLDGINGSHGLDGTASDTEASS